MIKKHLLAHHDVVIEQREPLYQGHFSLTKYHLKHRLFAGGWTPVFTRELLERQKAVGVLLYDPDTEQVVLIEQFRVGALHDAESPWLLEIVAGIIDSDETPQKVAQRECYEETGVLITDLTPICRYWISPGGTSEYMHLFCARVDASQAKGYHGLAHEHEDICVHVLSYAEAIDALDKQRINNATTIIALQWLQLHKDFLHKKWQIL